MLSIFNNLTTKISEINVSWDSVLSVYFNGAMFRKINEVQMKVKEVNSKIQYVYCFGHCLDFVLVDSLGNYNRVIFFISLATFKLYVVSLNIGHFVIQCYKNLV